MTTLPKLPGRRQRSLACWLHAHELAGSIVDSGMSSNTSRLAVDFNGSTTGAHNKSLSDAPHIPEDPEPSNLSSSSFDTVSPLHFHGLAETQTQTQVASCTEATGQGGAMPDSGVCIPSCLIVPTS